MKKLAFVILLWLPAFTLVAQYIPNNAQTFQFMPLFNPAFSGIEHYDDLKFSYRYQWTGFGDYSPRFLNISFNKRIVEPLDLAYNSLRLSDPAALQEEHLPRSKRMIHGLGGDLFHSEIGILKSIGGDVHYSIHFPLAGKTRFAGGVSVLVENRKLDVGEVTVRDPDQFYNHLLASSTSQTDLNIRAGALLYSERFYLGVTYFPVLYTALEASELAMTEPFYRGSVQAGVSVPLSADVTFKPSVLALVEMNNNLVVDYSVKASFKQNIWLGLTYRDVKSGVAILGWDFNDRLSASYSYEMSLGEFKQFNDGSHELVLALRLHNIRKYTQYTW
ncbi:MAG TPA: PorP/SprF family type IX secretion system membrane protein [Chryseosolibacter sp.]